MGLDISFSVDNHDELITIDYISNDEVYDTHQLSRTFCNFMCRRDVCDGVAELDQIGKLTGIDIEPFYDMQGYYDDSQVEEEMEYMESEAEKADYLKRVEKSRELVKDNIGTIHTIVSELIDKLSQIDNLNGKLDHGDWDSLQSEVYFADFNAENKGSHTNNNFGQDLRNFKRFVEFAQANGSKEIYFIYC